MIVLLLGLVCFVAALRVGRGEVRGGGALAWFSVLALLTLTQLALGSARMERYRLTLLGVRWRVADAAGAPLARELAVGGSSGEAELWVPGAGERAAATLHTAGSSALDAVLVTPRPDGAAIALVEAPSRGLSRTWRVLGGVPISAGDTVVVRGRGARYRLVSGSVVESLPVLGLEVPLPWVRVHVVRDVGDGDRAAAGEARLPRARAGILRRLRGTRPSVFQRTYPLADVLEAMQGVTAESLPPLSSFFYYAEGRLHLALVDEEVELAGGGAGSVRVWDAREGGRRLLVAGLPHRDYPEPDLELPERYGLRPLRSVTLAVTGGWLEARFASPEILSLDREALESLDIPGAPDADGGYRLRLAAGSDALARQAVVFDAPSSLFGVAGQALLRLPRDPRGRTFDVLTPSGLARGRTGEPFPLGTAERALVLRVDGQGASAGFWLVHLALFALAGLVFLRRPMTGPVFALALAATGLVCVRLLMGLSALIAFPHVTEAQQIALWLVPLVPWAVILCAEMGGASPEGEGASVLALSSWRRWIFHLLYALAVVGAAVVLFHGAASKQAVLAAIPVALLAGWAAAASGMTLGRRLGEGFRGWSGAHPRLSHGLALGVGLLLLRALLDALGFREQVPIGGTRVAMSVLYTPLVLLLLAGLLDVHGRRVREAAGAALPAAVARALLELGGFVFLALVAVGGWISDFGVALVLLPGVLVALAFLGTLWAPAGQPGRFTVLALGLPLVLFVALQGAPGLLPFGAYRAPADAADARMMEWNRNELLLLERGDPQALRLIGQRRSEALAVMRETMRSYTRGNLGGKGFLGGRVSEEIRDTATREHAPSALLASQWGTWGTAGLVLLLLSLLPPVTATVARRFEGARTGGGAADADAADWRTPVPAPAKRPRAMALLVASAVLIVVVGRTLPYPFNTLLVGVALLVDVVLFLGPAFGVANGWWLEDGGAEKREATAPPRGSATGTGPELPSHGLLALLVLFSLAFAGLYMVVANHGLALFTGKNVYLLGLDSVGDALESLVLLGIAAAALAAERPRRETVPAAVEAVWWHPSDGEGGGR